MSGVPGPMSELGALLVEDAVATLMHHMQNQFNAHLNTVFNDVQSFDATTGKTVATVNRNMQYVAPDKFYITEAIDPLECPAIFIVPDRTEHINRAQNFAWQEHQVMIGFLIEDVESTTLARLTWRYVRAGYMTLHDQQIGNLYCLIESVDYGPIFRKGKGDGRQYRKDATLRLKATHMEHF